MTTLPWTGGAPQALTGSADVPGQFERFHALYDEQFGRVAGYCYRLTGDHELSRDLAQEAFARLLGRWIGVRDPMPYLFHIATNLVRASWRARERESRAWSNVPETVPAPVDLAVRDAVDRLPSRYRELVLLHYYADLTVPVVAKAVRRPEGTVKRMLSEARAALALSLESPHD